MGRTLRNKDIVVVVIHCQDVVKGFVVSEHYATGTKIAQINTTLLRRHLGAPVRLFTDMIGMRAS